MELQKFYYDNKLVKYFLYATIIWGIIGFTFGITVASLFFFPELPEYLFGSDDPQIASIFSSGIDGLRNTNGMFGFGRLRMLHTSAVIFAFVGNAIFAGVYYSLPRLLKAPTNRTLGWINFWGWQLGLVLVVITFILGINTSKEYSEHEWPLDIAIAIVWIIFGLNMFITIAKRRVTHLYVAIWFYIATWIGITMLHIFNNLELPVISGSLVKSYSIYSGVQDALVQWWYGHNAVAFFLTTPVLGLMYYFMPKAAERPVFSYKLSIIHFWSLIFVYIWAGPHHLLYTALPAWAQMLGTVFSIMLIAPSWGGMLNGLLTLRGAWDRVREDPVLKMFVVAITCYGMATFEGPLLATKSINKIGHFTDWVIAHVHVGALGWNGMMAFGMIYWIIPRIHRTKLWSVSLANAHFWLATLGIIFYVVPMYISGFTQGLMWKEFNPDGTLLYKNWIEILKNLNKFYILRFIGGTLYLIGALLMVVNVWKTAASGKLVANEEAQAPALVMNPKRKVGEKVHPWIERTPLVLTILSLIALAIGGMVQILPTIFVEENTPKIASVKPYTPLELEGRDIYIREGCNACHSQMVRPFRDEVVRFGGNYSMAGEYVYDRPFLWGSKRTGPDLQREGGKNPDSWHFKHMEDPRSTSTGSIMPRYVWLSKNTLNREHTKAKLSALSTWVKEYDEAYIANADKSMDAQAAVIEANIFKEADDVKKNFELTKKEQGANFVPLRDREVVALISYLQRLGMDTKGKEIKAASNQ